MTASETPVRVKHLFPLVVLAEQLSPSYAKAVNRLPEEVLDEVKSGIDEGGLREPLCDALWLALKAERPSLDDGVLVEKIAAAMARRGGGPRPMSAAGRQLENLTTLFAAIDVNVGRASPAARSVLESEQGMAMLKKSIATAGTFLASRVLAGSRKEKT